MKSLMLVVAMCGVMASVLAAPAALAGNSRPNAVSKDISGKACTTLKNANPGNPNPQPIAGCGNGPQQQLDNKVGTQASLAQLIVNSLLYAAGTVSFIFILIGGFRYIASAGDSSRIQGAKDTVLYAVIGLIVAILAIPIADFVVNKVTG